MSEAASQTVAGFGALIAAAWLVAYAVPRTREMMLDWIGGILLQVLVAVVLWCTYSTSGGIGFWALLAAAWTLNGLATVGWGVHWWAARGVELPALSWVDGVYVARYVLALLAFWCLDRAAILPTVAASAVGVGIAWLALRTMKSTPEPRSLGRRLYPLLDGALVCAALFAWGSTGTGSIGVLAAGLLAYAAGNWINLVSQGETALPRLFWPLSDVAALVALLRPL